ncbi:MAG: hypothetical protein ACP5Q3_10920 [bacterium]
MPVEGFHLIQGGITCTSCHNTEMSALADMRNADQFSFPAGISVITGDPEIPSTLIYEEKVTAGKCVPDDKKGRRHISGCAPNNAYVVQAIIGKRGKAKQMYAERDLESTKV